MSTKQVFSVIIILGISCAGLKAQWDGSSTSDNSIWRNGNVGIGANNPETPLHIKRTSGVASTIKLQYGSSSSHLSQNSSGGRITYV